MADNIQEIFWMLDATTYNVIYVSPAFEKICGFPCQRLYDAPASYREIIHPDDRTGVLGKLEDLTRTGTFDEEFRIVRPDGVVRWVHINGFLARNSDGRVTRLVGSAQDITERKTAGQLLRDSEERFRLMAENIEEIFWIIEPKSLKLIYASPAYEKIWERPHEEIKRDPTAYLRSIHPEDIPRIFEKLERLPAAKRLEDEYRIVCPEGRIKWIFSKAFTARDPNGQLMFVGTTQDVTARHDSEEALRQAQKMDAIALLAGGISHDFNALLTGMLGYAELLLMSSNLTDSDRRKVEAVVAAAVQARAITQQLLTLGRKQPLKPTVVSLNALITDLADFLRQMAEQDIEIVTDMQWNLGGVKMDASQLTQVIMNLVANARDAMPHGGKLTIKTSALDLTESHPQLPVIEPGRYAVLAISDTGRGMDESTQGRIFEPFFTTKPEGKGTGLGLALVHGIIGQSAGYIRVSSRLGEGATFKILLPSTVEPVEERKLERTQSAPVTGRESILVVDDHDVARRLTRDFLSAHGYEVLVARDGREAIQIAKKRSAAIRLLLTDVLMPKISGPELAKCVSTLHPEAKVLYMTAYADVMDVANLGLIDRCEVLNKPYMHHELIGKVRQLLGGAVTR